MIRPRRWAAAGGVAGPVSFAAAWAVLGTRLPGYSPVDDAISRLAATDAATRAGMTGGLVALGAGLSLHALSLRRALPGPAWGAAAATGAATLAVAALPLGPGGYDGLHAVAAAAGYAGLAAIPLLAARPAATTAGLGPRWPRPSVAAGAACGALLAASTLGPAAGLLQRLGLSLGHGWVVASAVALLRAPRATG